MNEDSMLELLKIDLQRVGADLGDRDYLLGLIRAAAANLARQGIRETEDSDYLYLVVGTAAWMYRKRVNGETEPNHLRRMRHDLIFSQKAGGAGNAP